MILPIYSFNLLDYYLSSLSGTFHIDENNNGEVRFFFNLLNTWCEEENKTLIIIHHHNKGSNDANGNKTTSVRGASAIIDAVRVHYSISASDPRVLPLKNGKGKVIKVEQKMSITHRYCKIEKANHLNVKDPVFDIQLFSNKEKKDKSIQDTQVIIEQKLEVPAVVKCHSYIYECDEIPF